jgi:beta-galactosidase
MSHDKLTMDRREVLLTTVGAAGLLLTAPVAGAAGASTASSTVTRLQLGRGQLLDLGWRFRRGAGEGLEAPAADDSGWRTVDLPHDWSIEDLPTAPATTPPRVVGPFDSQAEGGTATGFTVGGEGWYRKRFVLPPPPGGRVEILFEGVYANSDVWLNGRHLGTHANGYTPFSYDLTPHLAASGENVLAVRVRNLGKNSRWYSGSGIYRHVWVDVLPEKARIARWGVTIATRHITPAGAELETSAGLLDPGAGLSLRSRIKDPAGRQIAEITRPVTADKGPGFTIAAPQLWSPDTPVLYTLETELRRGDAVLDRSSLAFGIRIVEFSVERGMTINGAPAKLRGGCIHHDNGLLGAAAFDAAEDRKVRLLKARGYNSVRPSHNLYSQAFLSACDRHGLLVIGETFDVWREPKVPQDYSLHFDADWRDDIGASVRSTRHHPSIILWSLGNEIPERGFAGGIETQWQLANEVHRLDPTRPVTAALNGYAGRPVKPAESAARPGSAGAVDQAAAVFLDVVGYNYKLADYERDHQQFPTRVFVGTESFPREMAAIWELTNRSPWLIGDFVWTAMDYLGEAGIGGSALVSASSTGPVMLGSGWPWVNAFCGDIDLIGQPKPPSLARDVVWGLSALEVAVQRPAPADKKDAPRGWGWPDEQPSWTWPGAEGKPLSVRVYTSGDRVELRLNGRALATKPVAATDLKRIEFTANYEPGKLEAVAFRAGKELARLQLTTTGAPAAVRVTPEHASGGAGRGDVSYIAIAIVDAKGQVVPDTAQRIELSLTGPAELVAFGTAGPMAVGSFQSPVSQTWNGRALAILRGMARAGTVRITVRSAGLKDGAASVHLV